MKVNSFSIYIISLMTSLLFLSNKVLSQDQTENLVNRFQDYQIHHLQEKLFIHTDRTHYLAGEYIRFKLYCMDASLHKPLSISKIAYIELINKEKVPSLQSKILIENGFGYSSLLVPSNLISGNYYLRAYTHRMINFDPEFYFEQPITIINPFIPAKLEKQKARKHYSLQFFPEGGNLVNGIDSKIGFKITDEFGKGIEAKGIVKNLTKESTFPIQTFHLGMGRFHIKPEKGQNYKVSIQLPDTLLNQNLPLAYESGYVMSLIDIDSSQLKIDIKGSPDLENTGIYLFIQSHNQIKKVLTAVQKYNHSTFLIEKSSLGEGIIHFTLFNAIKQPISERLYFIKPKKKLYINASTDRKDYPSRAKVMLNINSNDQNGKPINSELSISVFLLDSIQSFQFEDINAYLFLRSELAGYIENPSYYFQNNLPEVQEATDNLMLTQGWRRFKWEEILSNQKPYFKYITENEGMIITGKVVNKKSGFPEAHILASISNPGINFDFRPSLSDSSGIANFNIKNFYGTKDLVIQILDKLDSSRIELENPFSNQFSSIIIDPFHLNKTIKNTLVNRSINAQIQKVYFKNKSKSHPYLDSLINPFDTVSFYSNPDRSYLLDDYKRFTNMEEVLREFILDVHVRKYQDHFHFKVSNTRYQTFFEEDPLTLLDGVLVKDLDKIINFDPLKIKTIDVITRKSYLGPLINEGVIIFKSYQGDLGGFNLDPNSVVIEFKGLQKETEFYSPQYLTHDQRDNKLPDFRNTLYWKPNFKTDTRGIGTLEFYTSDLSSAYGIVVQGISSSGLTGSTSFILKVTK